MRLALVIAITSLMCATLPGILPGHAEKRVSLVIGNSAYQHVGRLANPASDAAAMAALFKAAHFDVVEAASDLTIAQMRRAISSFAPDACEVQQQTAMIPTPSFQCRCVDPVCSPPRGVPIE